MRIGAAFVSHTPGDVCEPSLTRVTASRDLNASCDLNVGGNSRKLRSLCILFLGLQIACLIYLHIYTKTHQSGEDTGAFNIATPPVTAHSELELM